MANLISTVMEPVHFIGYRKFTTTDTKPTPISAVSFTNVWSARQQNTAEIAENFRFPPGPCSFFSQVYRYPFSQKLPTSNLLRIVSSQVFAMLSFHDPRNMDRSSPSGIIERNSTAYELHAFRQISNRKFLCSAFPYPTVDGLTGIISQLSGVNRY